MVTQQPYAPVPGTMRPARRGVPVPVVVLVALLFLIGAGGFVAWGVVSERYIEPRQVVRGYYDAMAAQEWGRAHDYLSAAQQAAHPPADLERGGFASVLAITPSVDDVRIETAGGHTTAVAKISYATRNGASMWGEEVPLVREGGRWKLDAAP